MEKQIIKRKIKINKENDQWKLHQLFGEYALNLDRLPDAREIQRNPLRSAPQGLTEMVF
jgi:hypothetical protein